ncbi:MAG: acetate kinase, partial [Lachnospiraceae bacterium]|nr:acetate kinase [Lachnospiraceae bacterium]
MNVLVINCGSSSLKFQLINSDTEAVLAKGICERIGIDGQFTYQPSGGEKEKSWKEMPTHTQAIKNVLDALTNEKTGVISHLDEIDAVGHRVVHGGEKFASSSVINDEMLN